MSKNYKLKTSRKNIKQYKKGKLVVKYNLSPIPFEGSIDWDYKHNQNINTYQVYLHSLNFIQDFILVAQSERKNTYFKLARNIIMDWYKFARTKKDNAAWNEHATSSRIMNIIDFQLAAGDNKLDVEIFQKIVKQHCGFLYLDSKYKYNNHGLMMDNSLLYASRFIENETLQNRYISKAILRIKLSIRSDISSNSLHLENSPEYHKLYLSIMRKIINTCSLLNIKLGDEYETIISHANELLNTIIKPNLELPLLGDTGKITEKLDKNFDDFIDNDAGLVIFQKQHPKYNLKSSYFTFNSGYKSKTHKHFDDLSITYYLNGHDLFIDSGKYSYNRNDKMRQYILSPAAHSTIYVKDNEYQLHSNPWIVEHDLKIDKTFITKDYKLVSGINNLYPNVHIKRTCILISGDILIIIDNIVSKKEQTIVQNFNLSLESVINRVDDNNFNIKVDKSEYTLSTSLIHGENISSYISEGHISLKFGEIMSNKKAIFEATGNDFSLITTVAAVSHAINILNYNEDLIELEINKVKYNVYL